MITGSVAMNHYATPRMTRDIDIVIEMKESDVASFLRAFHQDFHLSEDAIRAAVRENGVFSSIHIPEVVKVDFVVRGPSPYRQVEFQRRRLAPLGPVETYLVSPEDLILSKLAWAKESGSELQLRDVRGLLATVDDLDWTYLDQWSAELSVSKLLRDLR